MPLFGRKDKPQAPPYVRKTDIFVGDPDALRLHAALSTGRWQETHDFLEGVRDWRLREFYVNVLAAVKGRPGWIDEWVAARPDSAIPLLFSGWQRINWAWEARGTTWAIAVKDEAWPVYQARLVDADRELAKAAAIDESDPTPVARSIWVAMGLELGQAEIRRRFEEASGREHLNQAACYTMIQASSRKWGGSHEAMFEFARWVSAQAPDGSPCHTTVALAHLERWLDLPRQQQAGYFTGGRTTPEVRRAAERSIHSAAYPGGPPSWADRNTFAFCFWLGKDYTAVIDQMRLIGRRLTPGPWYYQGDPIIAYDRARRRSLLAIEHALVPPLPGGQPR